MAGVRRGVQLHGCLELGERPEWGPPGWAGTRAWGVRPDQGSGKHGHLVCQTRGWDLGVLGPWSVSKGVASGGGGHVVRGQAAASWSGRAAAIWPCPLSITVPPSRGALPAWTPPPAALECLLPTWALHPPHCGAGPPSWPLDSIWSPLRAPPSHPASLSSEHSPPTPDDITCLESPPLESECCECRMHLVPGYFDKSFVSSISSCWGRNCPSCPHHSLFLPLAPPLLT